MILLTLTLIYRQCIYDYTSYTAQVNPWLVGLAPAAGRAVGRGQAGHVQSENHRLPVHRGVTVETAGNWSQKLA